MSSRYSGGSPPVPPRDPEPPAPSKVLVARYGGPLKDVDLLAMTTNLKGMYHCPRLARMLRGQFVYLAVFGADAASDLDQFRDSSTWNDAEKAYADSLVMSPVVAEINDRLYPYVAKARETLRSPEAIDRIFRESILPDEKDLRPGHPLLRARALYAMRKPSTEWDLSALRLLALEESVSHERALSSVVQLRDTDIRRPFSSTMRLPTSEEFAMPEAAMFKKIQSVHAGRNHEVLLVFGSIAAAQYLKTRTRAPMILVPRYHTDLGFVKQQPSGIRIRKFNPCWITSAPLTPIGPMHMRKVKLALLGKVICLWLQDRADGGVLIPLDGSPAFGFIFRNEWRPTSVDLFAPTVRMMTGGYSHCIAALLTVIWPISLCITQCIATFCANRHTSNNVACTLLARSQHALTKRLPEVPSPRCYLKTETFSMRESALRFELLASAWMAGSFDRSTDESWSLVHECLNRSLYCPLPATLQPVIPISVDHDIANVLSE